MDISCRGKMIHLLLLLLELRDELAVVQLLGQLYTLGFPKRRDPVYHPRTFQQKLLTVPHPQKIVKPTGFSFFGVICA